MRYVLYVDGELRGMGMERHTRKYTHACVHEGVWGVRQEEQEEEEEDEDLLVRD